MQGNSLPKVEILAIFGGRVPTPGSDWREICTARWTHVPLGNAKFYMNRCNESPLWGKNSDFQPVSKFEYQL